MWNLGFDAIEIMPEDFNGKVYFMSGYGANKKISGVYEPLYVRVAIMLCAGFIAVFIAYDLTEMTYADTSVIRAAVYALLPGKIDAVSLMFTHSHAAIDTMGIWGDLENGISGRDEYYMRLCRDQTLKCVKNAYNDMRDGELFFGHIDTPGIVMDIRTPVVMLPLLSRFVLNLSVGLPEQRCSIIIVTLSRLAGKTHLFHRTIRQN